MKTDDLCREYANRIDNVKLKFDSEMCELAKQFTDNVINPVCEKYGLKFVITVNDYHFLDLLDGQIITPEYVEEVLYDLDRDLDGNPVGVRRSYQAYEDMQSVFDMVETQVFNDLFVYWL